MRNLFVFAFLVSAAFSVLSCGKMRDSGSSRRVDTHSSRNSLDWEGAYAGDSTHMILRRDGTYKQRWLEVGGAVQTDEGSFRWNDDGNTVILGQGRLRYQVGEQGLKQLDGSGNEVQGAFLLKEGVSPEGIDWRLALIEGETVSGVSGKQQPFLHLNAAENRITGNGGCNRFFGTYELQAENQLRLSRLVSTKMACDALGLEGRFMRVLEKVSSYRADMENLALYDSSGIEIARFEREFFR